MTIRTATAALAASLAVAGCAGTMGGNYTRIADEATYRAEVVGHTLSLGSAGRFTPAADGTFSGSFGGAKVAGTWDWRDGAWCRDTTEGPVLSNSCQIIEIDGDRLRSTPVKGGRSYVYTIEG